MKYRGRTVDALAFWNKYVEFPNVRVEEADGFAPKVQCPNPAHDTDKRHFQVNLQEPMVHCFAHCGISGTWEHAICVIEGLYEKFKVEDAPDDRERKRRRERALREARKIILRHAKIGRAEKPVRRNSHTPRATKAVPANELRYESYLPQVALDYLDGRGITADSVAAWNLGWLPDEKRIAIPARDENGRIRFLIKRSVLPQQQTKYLYTEGYPKTSVLFGACQIDPGMVRSDGLILVEGSVDTILFHQHDLRITGGILGTGISDAQCRIIAKLRPPRIILAFDKDSAGIKNIEIAAGKLRKYPLYVMKYPKLKSDPAELTREEAYRQIERAVPLLKFTRELERKGISLNVRRRKEISFG